jgi:hypothetical protein
MIEPLARGVDPVQLAFHALVSMGARVQPTESPLAVALVRLGVDLARGERFTTAEAREFVSLIRATLEAVGSAIPADQPAYRTGALLDTARLAMRDLQHALTTLLTEHRQLTTSLAPILEQLLVAMRETEALPPGPRPTVPARFAYPEPPTDTGRTVPLHEPSPTLARLVSSLLESIARLQAVLPLAAAPHAREVSAPVPAGGPATALPAATTRLLQTLVEAIAELLTLLPLAATPGPASATRSLQPGLGLARCLEQAVSLLHEALPVTSGQASVAQSPIPGATGRLAAAVPAALPPSFASIGRSAAQVIGLVRELLSPPLPMGTTPNLPPLLMASMAQVLTQLKAGLPSAVPEAETDEAAPLPTGTLLARLQGATDVSAARSAVSGVPVSPNETLDAYRWGLLVALNYKPAVGRPSRARVSSARPRCEMCDRLLEQTPTGALVCPAC